MYLAFYDLKHDPFPAASTAPPLYAPPRHIAAVARIMDAIAERRGFMALLGEAGMGKTSLIRAHLAQTDPQQLQVISLPQADMPFEMLVQCIYDQLGFVAPLASLPEMMVHLHALVIEEHNKGRNTVLVIDDAHTMPLETLGNLHLLSNIEPYSEKLLQIVLVAQPYIEQQLYLLDLIKAGNPFTTVAHLQRFSSKESARYIRKHIAYAQARMAPVLSRGALRAIATSVQGVPQRLQRVCTEVLVAGYRSRVQPVPPGVARRAIAAHVGHPPRLRLRTALVSAASVLLVAAGVVGYGYRSTVFHASTASSLPQELAASAAPVVIQEPVEVASEPFRTVEPSGAPFASASIPPQSLQPAPPVPPRRLPGAADAPASVVQQAASFVHRSFPNGGDFRLNVWTEKDGRTVYSAGERLVVYVVAETTAYLQVDYYQADGQVVHLLPNSLDTNRVVAGQTFSLGQPESGFQFGITPPFGAEMLIVIASQRPFTSPQGGPNVEPAGEYMARLQQNLREVRSNGKVAVAHLDLRTQKQ